MPACREEGRITLLYGASTKVGQSLKAYPTLENVSYCRAAKCRHFWQTNCFVYLICLAKALIIQGIFRRKGGILPVFLRHIPHRVCHITHAINPAQNYPFISGLLQG